MIKIDVYFCGEENCCQMFSVLNNVDPESCPICLSKEFSFSFESKCFTAVEVENPSNQLLATGTGGRNV